MVSSSCATACNVATDQKRSRSLFGFHDGLAQPRIRGVDGRGVATGEFILGYENHYGLIPPTPVVPRDLDPSEILPPLSNPYHSMESLADLGKNGSYLVYRKLQQDVAGFWQFMARRPHAAVAPTRPPSSGSHRSVWTLALGGASRVSTRPRCAPPV